MSKKSDGKLSENQSKIVKCIFKGLSLAQIAKEMFCSQSCISYHVNSLYAKYNAKNRSEFILSVFSEILDNYKSLLDLKNSKIAYLVAQNKKLKRVILGLLENKNKSDAFEYWASEAKNCF